MQNQKTDDEVILQKLYDIFKIRDEDYITDTKLLFIFHFLHASYGSDTLSLIAAIRNEAKRRSNQDRLNTIYITFWEESIASKGYGASGQPPKLYNSYVYGHKLG